MASLAPPPCAMSTITVPRIHSRHLSLMLNSPRKCTFPRLHDKRLAVSCTNLSPWEPSPVTYAPIDEAGGEFLKETANIFDTLSSDKPAKASGTKSEELTKENTQPSLRLWFLKLPMWVIGPSVLLLTGMVPTLWLPLSSVFLGPNIASLLSLTGLDCIFNLGASLFLLMADSCARSENPSEACKSRPPPSYQFWNMVATTTGFIVPLIMLFGSEKGFLQPQLPSISFAVLLGPYFLLLSVQILMELLTWHWQSPVWLVTPVVYESYRILQLMRGLKLGAELGSPSWTVHTIRGLVCWWLLILGMQLMRVAWYAGFTARARQSSALAEQ